MANLRDHVLKNIPRCLSAVTTAPAALIEDRGADSVAFRISLPASGEIGEVHGYDLRDYNPQYKGSLEFISPLNVKWLNGPTTLIFDSDLHGYHGEEKGSANLRGKGEPMPFSCLKCGKKAFAIVVQFDYWEACHDLWDDEPGIRIENYFTGITVAGECVSCQHRSIVLGMDV